MKRVYVLLALISAALLVVSCGGGGGGSSGSPDEPRGQSPGVPSSVQLLPAVFASQTNGTIVLNAKVLDGNGNPVANVPVSFVKLTTLGDLSTGSATTNTAGIATATVSSTISGFVAVEAAISPGQSQVRDGRIVFFSAGRPIPPEPDAAVAPTLALSVDSNINNVFDEPEDFVLFDTPQDRFANMRATVRDATGRAVEATTVTFVADSSEATFVNGPTAQTDASGVALKTVEVVPGALRPTTTALNIGASAQVGDEQASNLVTLFLEPVSVANVEVFANPPRIDSGANAEVIARATTTAGTPLPDGVTINFTATGGAGIDPFAQTPDGDTKGAARAQFTAPTLEEGAGTQSVTVTASVGGKSGTAVITVVAPPAPPAPEPEPPAALAVVPINVTVPPGGAFTYLISGGQGPYRATVDKPTIVTIDGQAPPVTIIAGQFTVANNLAAPCTDSTVVITVVDSANQPNTSTVNYVIDCP